MKNVIRSILLALSLLVAAPAFAVDAQPVTKAAPAKVVPAAKAPTKAAAKAPAAKAGAPVAEKKAEPAEKPAPVPEAQVDWWEPLAANAIKLGFTLVSLMLTILISVLARKYGFEAWSDRVNELVGKAAAYAEQKSVAASKLEEGKITSGAEKMKMAIGFAQTLAKDYKVKDKGADWWERKLEAWLGTQED